MKVVLAAACLFVGSFTAFAVVDADVDPPFPHQQWCWDTTGGQLCLAPSNISLPAPTYVPTG